MTTQPIRAPELADYVAFPYGGIDLADAALPQSQAVPYGRYRLSDETHIFSAQQGCGKSPVGLDQWQLKPWWFPSGVYLTPVGYTDPPRVPFAVIRQNGALADNVVLFGRSPARPSALLDLSSALQGGARPDLDQMKATSGLLAAGTGGLDENVSAIIGYEATSAIPPEDLTAGGGTVWIGLLSGEQSAWTTVAELLDMTPGSAPRLTDAHAIFDSKKQQLFLLGDEVGRVTTHNVLHALDLQAGTWSRIGKVDGLGEIGGYSVSHDPLRLRALVLGGGASPEQGTVMAVDLATGLSYRVAAGDASVGVARRDHGAFFDPQSRTLYAAGGTTAGVERGDVIALDVDTGQWRQVAADDPAGPAARLQPVLYADARLGKVWLAGGHGTNQVDQAPELRPWELDPQTGGWIARPSLTAVPPAEPGVTESTFSTDSRPRFLVAIDPAAPLPGEVRLITVGSSEPNLQLVLQSEVGAFIASDDRVRTEHSVALLGDPGAQYVARVLPGPGYPAGATVPITVRDRPATLSLVHEASLPGIVSGVVGVDGVLYVARNAQIRAYDVSDPASPQLISSLWLGAWIGDVSRCGPRLLCTAHGGWQSGLRVIDVSDPADMALVGSLAVAGRCRSVTASGASVYLACGSRGVAQVSIIEPTQPFLYDMLDVGDVDVAVKARRGLLVVASRKCGLFNLCGNGGQVKVYRSFGGGVSELIGQVSTDRRPRRLYLGAQLIHVAEGGPLTWLKCLSGGTCPSNHLAEVFAVDEIAGAVDLVGSYSMSEGQVPFGEVLGDLVVHAHS